MCIVVLARYRRQLILAKVVLSTLNAKFIHSSLALRYLRAAISKNHHVKVLEYTIHDPIDMMVADIFEEEPDVIGLSCYIWNIEQLEKLIPLLRKVLPDVFILLGGPEVAYDAKFYMDKLPAVDAVAIGEGEELLNDLLHALHQQSPVSSVLGLCYRAQDQVVFSGAREIVSLEHLPTPYPDELMDELNQRVVYYEASRGCPFTCQYCLSSIEENVRYFPLPRVLNDLGRLIASRVKQINFVDRTFNLKKDYAMAVFSFLAQTEGETTFHFEITGDVLHPQLVEWLVNHAPLGKFRFEVGVQSTNQLANQAVKRRQNFDKLAATVQKIKSSGRIHQHLDLIAGLPYEDYGSFRKSFNDVYQLEPDELQLGFLKLLRGTNLRSESEKYGYIAMDRSPYEVLSNNFLSYKDLIRLKRLEDILEKYYNSGRFKHLVAYIAKACFETAFDFYQSFGDYWHDQGWSRIGHQPLDLVNRLRMFLQFAGVWDEIAYALLRVDFTLSEKQRPRRLFWRHGSEEHEQDRWLQSHQEELIALFPELTDDFRLINIAKRVVIERIPREAFLQLQSDMYLVKCTADVWTAGTLLFLFPNVSGTPRIFGWTS